MPSMGINRRYLGHFDGTFDQHDEQLGNQPSWESHSGK